MDLLSLIDFDPAISQGRARIKGTRVPISVILDNLAAGLSEQEILHEYPTLPAEAVKVALAYAAELAREEALIDAPTYDAANIALNAIY
jgi:uncharacterized protein (DUF433 family)